MENERNADFSVFMQKLKNRNLVSATQTHPPFTPVQLLICALLENAASGLKGMSISNSGGLSREAISRRRTAKAEEDRCWFLSDSDEAGSFVWCCEAIGVSPSYLRRLAMPMFMTAKYKQKKKK